jgi:PAS domain S-box-containing protein
MSMAAAWHLLMVEDDRSYVLLLRAYLDAWAGEPIELDHVSRLSDALERLAVRDYDAVLLDLGLPDGVGSGLVERLCQAFPTVPVIVLTGLDDDRQGAQAIEAGAREYHNKTRTDGRTLWSAIQNAVVRQRLEMRVRESETEHRALFYENPFPVFVYDSETWRFLAVNDAAAALYGHTRDLMLAMTVLELHPDEDVERVRERISGVLPDVARSEWKQLRRDGSLIEVELTSHPVSFRRRPARLVIVNDVTEQRRAEAALRASEQRLREMFQQSLGFMCMHGLDGRIQAINPAGAAFLGAPAEALVGSELGEHLPAAARDAYVQYLAELRRSGTSAGRLAALDRQGGLRVLEYSARVYEHPPDEPVVMTSALDVTRQLPDDAGIRAGGWSDRPPSHRGQG